MKLLKKIIVVVKPGFLWQKKTIRLRSVMTDNSSIVLIDINDEIFNVQKFWNSTTWESGFGIYIWVLITRKDEQIKMSNVWTLLVDLYRIWKYCDKTHVGWWFGSLKCWSKTRNTQIYTLVWPRDLVCLEAPTVKFKNSLRMGRYKEPGLGSEYFILVIPKYLI